MKKKKVARKEKPAEVRFTIVRDDDVRIPKYLHNDSHDGFSEWHARQLASEVPGQQFRYAAVPVHVFEQARAAGEPVSAATAVTRFQLEEPEG